MTKEADRQKMVAYFEQLDRSRQNVDSAHNPNWQEKLYDDAISAAQTTGALEVIEASVRGTSSL